MASSGSAGSPSDTSSAPRPGEVYVTFMRATSQQLLRNRRLPDLPACQPPPGSPASCRLTGCVALGFSGYLTHRVAEWQRPPALQELGLYCWICYHDLGSLRTKAHRAVHSFPTQPPGLRLSIRMVKRGGRSLSLDRW